MGFPGAARRKARRQDAEVARGTELLAQGRAEEAERLLGDLTRSREQGLGPADPAIIAAREAHADALLTLDRPADAASAYATLVAECRQAYGDSGYKVFIASLRLNTAQLLGGRYAEAESLARTTIADFTGLPDADGVFLDLRYVGRLVIGEAMAAAGRHADALAWCTELAPAAARDLGEESVPALSARVGLSAQLHLLGRDDEAAEAAAHLVAATALMDGHWPAAAAVAQITTLSPAAAETAARTALAAHEARLGADHQDIQALRIQLSSALGALGRHEDALAVMASMPTVVPVIRPVWSLRRAEVLHAAGHQDAPAAAREAAARCSARYAPAHYGTLSARTLLAAVSGTPAERISVADAWETHFGPTHPKTVAARAAAAS